ncbi:MAG: 50S ribosomal protein L11 methyltransferase [Flavobacteriaceae bacterium]|nr:50S ribosomal protein L11 methyltransferase [Eudoraea sp.]MBT8283998.1 50S ribosomal protein L11 methyltransferase [Muriicola sp.]NNK12534.1 50S ribosomal protein L11 methyltransferase [Flavobacteriaceae bacterium]MBT8291583.1 50S ribosomal protein L11 methyltransferase [Muriicola sp.]NNC63123.1 50S ribosomal protein L11 methyltransferase [Eudoraea sp.]
MSYAYLEYHFEIVPRDPGSEILLAELAELPFESFEETENGLKAYVRRSEWEEELLGHISLLDNPAFKINYHFREIPAENWNKKWETHFDPIEIDTRCRVRAPFHAKEEVSFDIVIEPKMSFGTGHHETTYLMLKFILDMDLQGKSVLDMGCGTAVLAILSAMKGARSVDAIDIDHWSYVNSLENVKRNNQEQIRVLEGDVKAIPEMKYDLILANINRNILLSDISAYSEHLEEKGQLLLSGFYKADSEMINRKCLEAGLRLKTQLKKNSWMAVLYHKDRL